MQGTNFTASNGEGRNPLYEGQHDGETPEQAKLRLHWVTAMREVLVHEYGALPNGGTVTDLCSSFGHLVERAFAGGFTGAQLTINDDGTSYARMLNGSHEHVTKTHSHALTLEVVDEMLDSEGVAP